MTICKRCGAQVEDGSKFCTHCGAKMERSAPVSGSAPASEPKEKGTAPVPPPAGGGQSPVPPQPEGTGKKPGKKKALVIAGVAGGLALVILGGILVGRSLGGGKSQTGALPEQDRQAQEEQDKERQERRELKEQLAELLDGAEDYESYLEQVRERLEEYGLSEEERGELQTLLEKAGELRKTDYQGKIELVTQVKDLVGTVRERLDREAQTVLEDLKALEAPFASEEEKARILEYAGELEGLIRAGEYEKIPALAEEWTSLAQAASQKRTGLEVRLMQYDLSEYPTVRLYLDVRPSGGGESLTELSPQMFYLSERSATGEFLSKAVDKVSRLDENERLNLDLLADTSGSMEGENLAAAKSIMREFLGTVQFSAGDRVKLTPFNSEIGKLGVFREDLGSLESEIEGYIAAGQTKLYDAIIYGVQDVSGQEGARCVLAFTDGSDVGSFHSAQDVVDVVSQYKIPVFIVGIGDGGAEGSGELRRIAEASGGAYKSLPAFTADLTDFYDTIYRQMKGYYMVEYTTDAPFDLDHELGLSLYVQDDTLGGEATLTVRPQEETFDSLLGAYLRSYIYDMNRHTYDQLGLYVDAGVDPADKSSIQYQMKKQVSGGYGEIEQETLMDYQVTELTAQDENTVLLKANENYDVIYCETMADLQVINPSLRKAAESYFNEWYGEGAVSEQTLVRIWVRINQSPTYILKRGADGDWKFSAYSGGMNFGPMDVYDGEILG